MNQKKLEQFKLFLQKNGCEILPNTNPYELLRFKGVEVGVIYTTGKYSGKYALDAVKAFENKTQWFGGADKTKRSKSFTKKVKDILSRDGPKCFFCGDIMKPDDRTLEHLIQLSR